MRYFITGAGKATCECRARRGQGWGGVAGATRSGAEHVRYGSPCRLARFSLFSIDERYVSGSDGSAL